jgi:hypothetical protein
MQKGTMKQTNEKTIRRNRAGRWLRRIAILLPTIVLCFVGYAAAQNPTVTGRVPSGPGTNEVLRLTLRDAITIALRYNFGSIESGENAQIARSQRLLALSRLLPQLSVAPSNVERATIQQVFWSFDARVNNPLVVAD